MAKTKILSIIAYSILFAALLGSMAYYFKDRHKPSISVCKVPDDCKTVYGAEKKDLENIIGYPADFHRNNSTPHVQTPEDFMKGYFDEKAFYYAHESRVFYFISAKIRTGFSEDTGELIGSNAKTFEIIDANFSKDKRNVYGRENMDIRIAAKKIEGADPKSFATLDFPYAKDKRQAYYLNHAIPGADAASFAMTENKLCAKDKNNFYKDGEIATEDKCK